MAKQEFTDAIALLKADHATVKELFEKFESARSGKRGYAEKICTELKIHATIEEEIFYPAVRGKIEDEDVLNEAYVEHDGAKILINDIMSGDGDDAFFEAKVTVLQEEILHHVKEEEGDLFKQVRAADIDLVALRDQMMARKQELVEQAKAGGLPPAQLTVVTLAA